MSALIPAEPPAPFPSYASFWQRFAAALIDVVVLLPVLLMLQRLAATSRAFALGLQIPITGLAFAYFVYAHARFGCTVGKFVMRIRVVRVDGARIGWPESLKRSSVDAGFAVLHLVGMFSAIAAISEAEFAASSSGYFVRLKPYRPGWVRWADIAANVWGWSELVVMLFNRQRRALHDFIAGTIVVSLK